MSKADRHGPHQGQKVVTTGTPLTEANAAMILVHGRGASAESILDLANYLTQPEMAYFAPQAANHTWYPNSFLAPMASNQPGLDSGLQAIANLVAQIKDAGIPTERIVLAGFSQGACLASEFVARHAQRYGGLLVFSGGVIGPPDTPRYYAGSLDGTPVFIGCSDRDAHIPLERVEETAVVLENLGADVNKKIYPGMGHTIIEDEIEQAQAVVTKLN